MKKLLLVLLAGLFLAGCNRVDNHQPLSTQHFSFAKSNVLGQSFVAHYPNLNVVMLCLRNPSRVLTPMRFELLDSSGMLLRSLDFTGGNIDNSDCTRFQFAPIPDSQGKTYKLQVYPVLAKNLSPSDLKLALGDLYVEAHNGELHYKTLYSQALPAVIQESVAQFFPRLAQDPLALTLYLILLFYVLRAYRRSP